MAYGNLFIFVFSESHSGWQVANDDTTSAVSPTRRGAHEKTYEVWNTESPAKRLCLSRSVDALARLPKHINRPRCLLRVVNSGIHSPHPLDLRVSLFSRVKNYGPQFDNTLGDSRRIPGRGNYVFEFYSVSYWPNVVMLFVYFQVNNGVGRILGL